MAKETKLTSNQSRSDFEFGLECFEDLKTKIASYRQHGEEAYGTEFKAVLQKLTQLSESGVSLLQNYLAQYHPEPAPDSPDGQLLRPDVPEWRPGSHATSSSD